MTTTTHRGNCAHAAVVHMAIAAMAFIPLIANPALLAASDEDCSSDSWQTFPAATRTNNTWIFAIAQFDDASGPGLFVGGGLTNVSGINVSRIAKWNGHEWSDVGGGVNGHVRAMTVFDDGNGPALYVGGQFTEAGGEPAPYIARWDGANWSALGTGLNHSVLGLAVFDDGHGAALYAVGSFTEAGGKPAARIAKWDGTAWSPLGDGLSAVAHALAVVDSDSGPNLVVGGSFTQAGDVPANRIARWDGEQWHALGDGFNDGIVSGLAVIGDADDATIVAGGSFTESGEEPILRIAYWDGEQWRQMGDGFNATVRSLLYDDFGDGPALYAGGVLTDEYNNVARWDGERWELLRTGGGGLGAASLAAYEDASGRQLYAGGRFFLDIDPGEITSLKRWNGERWALPGEAIATPSTLGVYSLIYFDDGSGEKLYLGGGFMGTSSLLSPSLMRWDGQEWSSIGATGPMPGRVRILAVSDIDGEPSLYAGGWFILMDGKPISHFARWNGSEWLDVGGGVTPSAWTGVSAIQEFDDGSGPRLFVAGDFTHAGGIETSYIAAWDGKQWSPVGDGLPGPVNHMVVFDDGNGPSLYVSMMELPPDSPQSHNLMRWDGKQWHEVAIGDTYSWVHLPLAVHEGKLIVGGFVSPSDGEAYGPAAIFDGQKWASLDGWFGGAPASLATFDDGNGPALYAGVLQKGATGKPALFKWDGSEWATAFGGVVKTVPHQSYYVTAMTLTPDEKQLVIGGNFHHVGEHTSWHLAIIDGCEATILGDLNGDGVVDILDLYILLDAWGECPDPPDPADCPADLNSDGVVNVTDLLILFDNWS